jgi:hypothetical protein
MNRDERDGVRQVRTYLRGLWQAQAASLVEREGDLWASLRVGVEA